MILADVITKPNDRSAEWTDAISLFMMSLNACVCVCDQWRENWNGNDMSVGVTQDLWHLEKK